MVGRSDGQVNADAQMLAFEISPQLSDGKITVAGTYFEKAEFDRPSYLLKYLLHRKC
jgi:hypothetical protein